MRTDTKATVEVGDTVYRVTIADNKVRLEVITPTATITASLPQSSARTLGSAIMGSAAELKKEA